MRWLPIGLSKSEIDSGNKKAIDLNAQYRVPCSSVELIQVTSILGNAQASLEINSAREFQRLLRQSPGLLLFALSSYQRQLNQSPKSTSDFVGWCKLNLISALSECEIGVHDPLATDQETSNQFSFSNLHEFFKSFLAAKSNKEFRKSLRKFVVAYAGATKKQAKLLINQLVGKSVSADEIKCKRLRRVETRWEIIDRWRAQLEVDVEGLIEIALQAGESRSQFETRLQNEKLASMKQLAYGASHEINNPLANIATRAQTLLAKEKDAEKRHKLVVIYEQAIRAHEMISDMMLFAHPPALLPMVFDVRIMVRKIMKELASTLEFYSGIEVAVTVGVGVVRLEADATQISVAVKNLIKNSLESVESSKNRKGGRVEVRFDWREPAIEVSVWDNGMAISDPVKRHLFDPFYSGREAGRGLGFGLSKVWTIVGQHGGSVYLDEKCKTGTRFVISLPQDTNLNETPSETSSEITIRTNSNLMEEDAA